MEFQTGDAITMLRRTPEVLRQWLDGLPGPWLEGREGPETFSPREVVGHLIHGEETDWLVRTRIILEEGEQQAFEPFDRFGFRRKYEDAPIHELLGRFAEARDANLRDLESLELSAFDLERRGRHPELGPVTLQQLLAAWVVHDLTHVAQIARVLAKQYQAAIGPWTPYMGVLAR